MARAGAAALALMCASTTAIGQPAAMPIIPADALVRATPALWEIRDADTTIYLFGTFHTLDGRTSWFNNRVRQAFDGSDELVLETVVPTSREDRLAAGNHATEVTANGSRKLKPFLAGTQQVVHEGRAMGLSIDHGADVVLRRVAEGAGKPVGGLERFEDQLRQLARIPAPPASAMTSKNQDVISLNQLLTAWTVGDTRTFSTMLAGFESKSPVAYRMLIADRNARWGQWIVNRLDQPGTVFVAVGSGHLAGKHSVQSWLAARGISSTRVA